MAGARQANPTRFTDAAIRALPPRSSPYTDPGQTGLQMLVRAGRGGKMTRTWLLRFKFKGEESRILLGHFPLMTLDTARGETRRLRELADQGIDPRRARARRRQRHAPHPLSSAIAKPGDQHTVEYLITEFTERYLKPTRRRPEYAEDILNRDVLPEWKGRDARTIKPREVIELLDKIVERGSPVAANRTAALLGQLFKFGIHRAIVDDSPVKLLMRPGGKEQPRERTLSDDELKIFLADPVKATRFKRLAHVIQILLLTGQRRGELVQARWRDIDWKEKTWTIPDENSKTGRGHVVPLTDWAVDEFDRLKKSAGRSQWVLPAADKSQHLEAKLLTRGVAKCQARFKELGIQAFTLHDLRRTCRTGMARLKIEPHIAERVIGHAQEKIVATYDLHAYIDEKRAALEKWAAHLKLLMSPSHSDS
jgi:integrase